MEMTNGKRLWLHCCSEGKKAGARLGMACMPRIYQDKRQTNVFSDRRGPRGREDHRDYLKNDFDQNRHRQEP